MMQKMWRRLHALAILFAATAMPVIAWGGSDIYIPRTAVHFRCKFPDGSFTEYKEREKWYFYAEPLPHAQTSSFLDSTTRYVDAKGNQHLNIGTSNAECEGVGKRNDRLFFEDGFENLKGQFVHFTDANQVKGVPSPSWENFPKEMPSGTADQSEEVRIFMRKESLYVRRRFVVPINNSQALLFEQALVAFDNPQAPAPRIRYVYQSISTDYGKSWSAPLITKDAKLFEIGRLLTEQSWSPKVETLVKHRSVR